MKKTQNILHPISFYSKPLRSYPTKLGQMFEMPAREHTEKPNRSLMVTWNATHPLIPHFENHYSYFVTFYRKNAAAGNHYHKQKQEIIFPVVGNVTVLLEDIRTKEKEKLKLSSEKQTVLHIPTYIAHTVVAQEAHSVIFVTASIPSSEKDEIAYQLIP